ncbi:hypothetical protein VNO80_08041 [Phaseolus coccineus]|uniref:TFIIB-type domain-containing protein n=1 Tax=Phaseolus coccineus TaxID=3886 RepID=A0AAN9NKS6_PHACN
MADEEYCSDCKTHTPSVYDRSAGDTICSECGLVLESRSVDQTPSSRFYYRKLENEDKDEDVDDYADYRHYNRGFHANEVLKCGGLATYIACRPSSNVENNDLMKARDNHWRLTKDKAECNIVAGLKTMEQMASSLGLVCTITNHAKELYIRAKGGRIFGSGRNPKAYIVTCLYLACQEEGLARTLHEFYSVAGGVRPREIHKTIEMFKNYYEIGSNNDSATRANDVAKRFCCYLNLDNHVINAVKEVLQKLQEFDVRRKPASLLSATIYMVAQLSDNKLNFRDVEEVAKACIVRVCTLKSAYKDLHPLASYVIPTWYANTEDIKRLRTP